MSKKYRTADQILAEARAEKARVFTTQSGLVLELQEIPTLLLLDLHGNETGKPQPPEKVHPAGIAGVTFFDDNDPAYVEALKDWETAHIAELLRACILFGVKTYPPLHDPLVKRLRLVTPNADHDMIKLRWVQAQMKEDEYGPFIEHVMSQTTITEEGLAEAEATFRDMGERVPDNGTPVQE